MTKIACLSYILYVNVLTIVLNIFCGLMYILCGIMYALKLLYFVQMDGYTFSSILKNFYHNVLLSIDFYLFVVLCFCLLLCGIANALVNIVLQLMIFVLILMRYCTHPYYSKIHYTRRMIRLMVLFVLLLVCIVAVSMCIIEFRLVSISMPIILLCDYLLIFISLAMLYPIEKLIGEIYIYKARKKILSCKNLITIGITGSYGKTSTKEILSTILAEYYCTVSTPKSFNTPFGITKTILSSIDETADVFVCEMGAKKVGDIRELCGLVNCNCGIVTSVGRQHTHTFHTIDGVYTAKKELPDYLHGKFCVFNLCNKYVYKMYREYDGEKMGVYIVPARSKFSVGIIKRHNLVYIKSIYQVNISNAKYYAFLENNVIFAKKINATADGISFDIYNGNVYVCRAVTELIGVHNVINILLATAMALHLNVPKSLISVGINKVRQVTARLEKFVGERGAIILNNGYNSNIDSVAYSLQTLQLFSCDRKIVITPGLVETENDYEYNVAFGKMIAMCATDIVITKKCNREAILLGILQAGFDMDRVTCVDDFKSTRDVLNKYDSNCVILIENDLPDNYI